MQPGMGAGCEGGRCGFLLPASRISTKDTKGHEGKRRRRSQGDDRKSGPRTAAGADCEQGRSSLQPVCCAPSLVQFTVSEPELEGGWQHFGALTQFRCNCPGGGGVQPGMGAGCEGGRCGFLLPASRISTTQRGTKESGDGSQGDDRKSGPCTAAGADWKQSSLQPVCCAPYDLQCSGRDHGSISCFDSLDAIALERGGVQPGMGGGVYERKQEGHWGVYESLRESTRGYESLREFARVYESLREFARVYESLREFARVYESLRESTRVCESLREFARVCEKKFEK